MSQVLKVDGSINNGQDKVLFVNKGIGGGGGQIITYLSTTFTEAASGTELTGTTPATMLVPAEWGNFSSYDFSFVYANPGAVSVLFPAYYQNNIINIGVQNSVVRFSGLQNTENSQFLVRNDGSSLTYLGINPTASTLPIYDTVNGSGTLLGTLDVTLTSAMTLEIQLNGTQAIISCGGQSITVTTASVGTYIGMTNYNSASNVTVGSITAKSA